MSTPNKITACYISLRYIADWHQTPWRQLLDYQPLSWSMCSLSKFFFVHFTQWLACIDQYRINDTNIFITNILGTVSIWICRPLNNRFDLLSQTISISDELFPTRNTFNIPLLLTTIIKTYQGFRAWMINYTQLKPLDVICIHASRPLAG